ncbi:hypothetical protein CF597_17405 [Pseudomonas sp. PSB1]|nr:hypothetical protein [Pseudomonas sp. PSB1]
MRPTEISVGASLLAMATAQPTSSPADPPLSRASSLPQGIGGVTGSCAHPGTKTVGASLLAMATAQPTSSPADPPLSRASPLPQGIGGVTGSCCQSKSVWERA